MTIVHPENGQSPLETSVPGTSIPQWISHPDYSNVQVFLQECGNNPILHIQVPRLVLLKREIDILRTVDHPTLIRLEDIYEDDVNLHLVRTNQIQQGDIAAVKRHYRRACCGSRDEIGRTPVKRHRHA